MATLLLYLIAISIPPQTYALQRFYLEEECGGTIVMDDGNIPAGRLAVTRRSKYRSTFSCHVTIIAPEGQRLVIVFREMDIELEVHCDDDFAQFFDGSTKSSPIVAGLKTRLCGHKPPVGSYVTSGNTLTVYFQSDVYRQEDGFEIVFTAFHEAPSCHPSEFRCANGRCIASSLECDDFNNCGDSSDECKVDSEVLLAMVLSVFLLTIIATGVFLLMRKKKKHSKLRKIKQALADAFQGRVHTDVGIAAFHKTSTAIPCTCNKKPRPLYPFERKSFRHVPLETVQSTRSQGLDITGNTSSQVDIELEKDGTQITDAVEQDKTSENNEDFSSTKQTWTRKTM